MVIVTRSRVNWTDEIENEWRSCADWILLFYFYISVIDGLSRVFSVAV